MGSKTVVMNPGSGHGSGNGSGNGTNGGSHGAVLDAPKPKVALGIQSDASFTEAAKALRGRDLCSISDLTVQEMAAVMELAHAVKAHPEDFRHALDAKQMVLIFEKASLRTRLTFEAAINTCGGNAMFVDQTASPLGERESLADVAHNLERWMNVIVLRTYAHDTVTDIASFSKVPVINALSDYEHPCQAITDFMTIEERFGSAEGIKFTYIGDGNNVCHSLMLCGALLGAHVTVATPKGYEPKLDIIHKTMAIAETTGSTLTLLHDAAKAAAGADAIYTDVCISMGQENETMRRTPIFKPYQVNEQLMGSAAPHAVFMHCLPAHRGHEVTDAVIDGEQSVVFEQAENRLHAQKALLLMLLGGAKRIARDRGANGKRRRTLA